jgi:hypothetical protein
MLIVTTNTDGRPSAADILQPSGTGFYSHQTPTQLGGVVMAEADYTAALAAYWVAQPAELISEGRYFDMLDCLPPQDWHTAAGADQAFRFMEEQDEGISAFYCKRGPVCFKVYRPTVSRSADVLRGSVLPVTATDAAR